MWDVGGTGFETGEHRQWNGSGLFERRGVNPGLIWVLSRPTSHVHPLNHFPISLIRSTHRFAYPHSLSYQPLTFTIVLSTTFVLNASRMQL